MIKNLNIIKQQLSELASVINSFKSESVQLRIVELLLQGTSIFSEENTPDENAKTGSRRRGRKAKGVRKPKVTRKGIQPKKGSRTGTIGPATALTQLLSEGYFKEKHTIGEIINHCKLKKALKFKANELSSPLARFVRDTRLKRDTNEEGQFAYHK